MPLEVCSPITHGSSALSHQKLASDHTTGTFVSLHLTVPQAEILIRILDTALNRVDALFQRIDADLFSAVDHLSIAPERADPALTVGFNELRKARIVGKPQIEEVGVRRNTYLFFEFGDDLAGEIVLGVVVLVVLILLFLEAEGERLGGFIVSVEGVDEILAPNGVTYGVIVEVTDTGEFIPGFLGDRIVEDDVAIF